MTADVDPDEAIRVFAAVVARSTPALEALCARLRALGKAVRAVSADHLHVTLKFYGDVSRDAVPGLADTLERVASEVVPFDWSLCGTGAFPSAARRSVIWAGTKQTQQFAALADAIEAESEMLGFAREARRFHPHITLARVRFRPPAELGELLCETAAQEFGPQRAEEIVLFRSVLGSGGSVYSPLHVARLESI
jgi:RNA 2',3'-cyclic 3'-phosphodiesterase